MARFTLQITGEETEIGCDSWKPIPGPEGGIMGIKVLCITFDETGKPVGHVIVTHIGASYTVFDHYPDQSIEEFVAEVVEWNASMDPVAEKEPEGYL